MTKLLITDPCFGEASDAFDTLTTLGFEPVKSHFPIKEPELIPLM